MKELLLLIAFLSPLQCTNQVHTDEDDDPKRTSQSDLDVGFLCIRLQDSVEGWRGVERGGASAKSLS